MLTDDQIKDLLSRYRQGQCSDAERSAVEAWYGQMLSRSDWNFRPGEEPEIGDRIKARLEQKLFPGRRKKIIRITSVMRYAAVVALVAASATIAYRRHQHAPAMPPRVVHAEKLPGALPGGNRAVLTLGNGHHIVLDSANAGMLARQGNTRVVMSGGGQISYEAGASATKKPVFNTLTTPRGGKYELVLPDGSKVWLNAASSITFPACFGADKREVRVLGEAYFEIAPSRSAPFEVSAGTMKVLVLGTHFNVMAYQDEARMETTLLEGSVKVEKGDTALVLRPGQQARITSDGRMNLLRDVNEDKIIAWKNNLFCFDHDDIQSVMHQLARWYDLDVEIKGNIKSHFSGTLPQNVNASDIFRVLEQTGGIHFSLENQKVIVSP